MITSWLHKNFLQVLLFCCLYANNGICQTKSMEEIMRHREEVQKKAMNKPYLDFIVKDDEDNIILTNDSLKNKVVFINFWFEACPPCIAELEGLNQLYDSLKDDPDFRFVSFTFNNATTIDKMRLKHNISYPIYTIDRSECYRLNLENGFPTSFVLNKEYLIKLYESGGSIDEGLATKHIMKGILPMVKSLLQ